MDLQEDHAIGRAWLRDGDALDLGSVTSTLGRVFRRCVEAESLLRGPDAGDANKQGGQWSSGARDVDRLVYTYGGDMMVA